MNFDFVSFYVVSLIYSVLHVIAVLFVLIHVLYARREPASAFLWIFLTCIFPLLGLILYAFFGIDRVAYKALLKDATDELLTKKLSRDDHYLKIRSYWDGLNNGAYLKSVNELERKLNKIHDGLLPDHPLLGGNSLKCLVDGDDWYPRLFETISEAKSSINILSFIFTGEKVCEELFELLKTKAESGVRVRVLYDRFGSTSAIFRRFFKRYKGIENLSIEGWTQANFFKSQFQINLRNHRKIVVIDGERAFFGGLNFADYHWSKTCENPIRDYHFELVGPSVLELQYTFMRDWYFMTNEYPDSLLDKKYFPSENGDGSVCMRLLNTGPNDSDSEILSDSFFAAIGSATNQVVLVTPYFVPNQDILRALRIAALRGVDVTLLVPQKNNHWFAGWASRGLYEDLLKAGVKICERKPPFMHAKALLVDDRFAIIGSANIDVRSMHLNYETNMAVYSDDFVAELKLIVLNDLAQSESVTYEEWINRPKINRLIENFCLLMKPVL